MNDRTLMYTKSEFLTVEQCKRKNWLRNEYRKKARNNIDSEDSHAEEMIQDVLDNY